MDEIKIGSSLNQRVEINLQGKPNKGNFEDLLSDAMGKIKEIQRDAETAVRELARGGDITEAMIAIERADMSFQLMVEIRNRLLNAYEEIMRMQV